MPAELDELTRRVMRLEIEEAALAKENDPASRPGWTELRKELADLRAEADAMRAQWEAERQAMRRVQALREEWSSCARRPNRPSATTTLTGPPNCGYGRLARAGAAAGGRGGAARGQAGRAAGCCARSSPRRKSPQIVSRMDRHPGQPPERGRTAKTAPPRRELARAGGRPGRGRARFLAFFPYIAPQTRRAPGRYGRVSFLGVAGPVFHVSSVIREEVPA